MEFNLFRRRNKSNNNDVFVEKILVYKAEKVDGHRVQRIKIIYNGIGEIPTTPINEKTA